MQISRRDKETPFCLSMLWLGLLLLVSAQSQAAPTYPTPGDRVLIIYTSNLYNISERDAIVAALAGVPAPPVVDTLQVLTTSTNGFGDELTAAGYNLNDYCQVWDIRFNDANNTAASSGLITGESIAGNDTQLFQNFLAGGGHLYLQGDHFEYFPRNETLMQFITTATGSPIAYPSVCVCQVAWTSFDNSAPDFFQSNLNNLTGVGSWYPGYIPLGQTGNGTPLTTNPSYGALDILWQAPQLSAGNGKMMVSFDTNMIVNDANITVTNQSAQYIQNAYVTLSTCYNFDLTKTVDNPGPVCPGEQLVYSICVSNTGSRAITGQKIWDQLPSCFSYVSSTMTLAGSSNPGAGYYAWDIATLAPASNVCVDVRVTVNMGGPCP